MGNKIDERQTDINLGALSRKYPNIRGFHQVSCKTEKGLVELKQELIKEISNLDGLNDLLPASWFAVKEELEEMSEEYFSYETYLKVCRSKGITEEEIQNKLLERLHDLGIVLNFGKRIQDTNVLNPDWVTKGVYDILNANELFKSKGILKREMLTQILESEKYPVHKQLFIINIMQEFELCFAIDTDRSFLVPDLLSEEEQNTGSWEDSLGFEYQYNVFFGSIITRFIVKMHKSISKSTYWRTGVVLEYKVGNEIKNEALVKADTAERKIIIAARGDEHTRRDFLSIIRGKFEEIHRSFPEEFEENVAEKVPVPKHPNIVVDYKHLLNLERMREEFIIPEGMMEKLYVKDLLNGIESVEERQKQREVNPDSEILSTSAPAPVIKNVSPHFSPEEVKNLNDGKALETTANNLTILIEIIIGIAIIAVSIYKRTEIINWWLNGNLEPITFIYFSLVALGLLIIFFAIFKKRLSIEWIDGNLVKIIRWLAFKVKGKSLREYQDLCGRLEENIEETGLAER